MLLLDGVYVLDADTGDAVAFRWVGAKRLLHISTLIPPECGVIVG